MKHDELDSVINALKPAMVDRLADAAYERHSDAALIRAGASTVSPHLLRKRRPVRRLAFATGATAVVAATAVLAAGTLSGGRQGTHDGGVTGRNGAIDTRAFLLASADTAARQPATHGTCWYNRTRMWENVPIPMGKDVSKARARVNAGKSSAQMLEALTASSAEQWACTLPGGTGMRFRGHSPLDIQVRFPAKKNEAAWRAAGSPPLMVNGGTTASKPSTVTYDKGSHLVNPDIGSHEIEWRSVPKLPATRSGLESLLRRLWQEDRKGGANGYRAPADFGEYVFVSAWDLFMAPTTPGTRAALYRILADSPSVHVTGQIKDREGRSGAAITAQGVRLVVDPATAQLLDFEQLPSGAGGAKGSANGYFAFERQGWVKRIGALPAS
ncbi:hypothetical protein GCM10027176_28550 [Actinoallomurus bryophytorum]|uniref:CU044_5270 family protein n=1 Tax=Actinoallomurus bryophytorum TaxID=1490222 RepID=A0A543CGQ4_9ACTN|nr:hypothetical protein [Actinoallomurus bryophytorum]TQL96281.1 hypothetical protein FB559_1807 [Actinoallomurus bryophytorum]